MTNILDQGCLSDGNKKKKKNTQNVDGKKQILITENSILILSQLYSISISVYV